MPTAVISDIHGNAVALRAVLDDIDQRGVQRVVNLGDIIGYGPQPLECVDLVGERCEWSLLGNHDFAVLYEPTNFNPPAEAAAFWTRDQFDAEPDEGRRRRRYEFLSALRVRVSETLDGASEPILAVHGSPRRPVNEYIFPDDVLTARDKMKSIFDMIDHIALVGHTHVPGVFTDEPDFYPPDELGQMTYTFSEAEKAIINVGSVGQPRDHNPRAAYTILHDDRIEFIRVEYDVAKTADLIHKTPELSDWLGDRLFEGR